MWKTGRTPFRAGVRIKPLGERLCRLHHVDVWRRQEPVLDRETLDGIIRMLMRIDANVGRLLDLAEDDDGEEAAEDDA